MLPDGEPTDLSQKVFELLDAGSQDEARRLCEEKFRVDASDPVLASQLAAILVAKDRKSEALGVLSAHRAANPGSVSGYINAGVVLLSESRLQEAIDMLRAAVKLAPDSPQAHFQLACALEKQGVSPETFSECREHFRMAAELKPDWGEAHYAHGIHCMNSSREAEAEAALRKAAALLPENAEVHFKLGGTLLEQDRVSEAITVFRRVVELNPGHGQARDSLAKLENSGEKKRANRLARYPRSVKEFSDLRRLITDYILTEFPDPQAIVSTQSNVFTLGSCFAQNIATALKKQGVKAECQGYSEDINSTYANRYFLEWIGGQDHPQTRAFAQAFAEDYRQKIRGLVREANVVIISLGVAPCFFHRQTGEFVPMLGSNFQVALRVKECDFRTTSVAENVANLVAIVAALRQVNPGVKLVVTVSPVPLKATFERRSAVVADCISKSTLRVAAHEFLQLEGRNVIYWPSFEIVRWFGGHFAQVFGNDDGSPFHVSQQVVNTIVESFVRTFGSAELRARLDRQEDAVSPTRA